MKYHKSKLVYGEDPYAFGGYIKEGLVLQLDCRRYDVENHTWEELVNGRIFDCEGYGERGDNGGIIGADVWLESQVLPYREDYTVELVFMRNDSMSRIDPRYSSPKITLGYAYTKKSMRFDALATIRYYNTEGPYEMDTEEDVVGQPSDDDDFWNASGLCTYSADKNNLYLNAEIQSIERSGTWANSESDIDYFSFENGNYELYSIRVYNRPLTDEERDHNRQKDIENFGGQVVDRVFADEFSDEFE